MKKHYKTLGLEDGASQEEIETAYERLSKELDPKNNDHQEFFVEEYKKVCEAYDALSNSTILATERGSELSNTTKISTEENNREPNNNGKDLKSVKNWKGYFVFIFFLLVGLGPTTVVYYYCYLGTSYNGLTKYSEITRAEFLEMDFFNQSLYCFKQSINDECFNVNYFIFIFIYIVILFIFLFFMSRKRNIITFIVLVIILKLVLHFSLFPETEQIVNIDKKVYISNLEYKKARRRPNASISYNSYPYDIEDLINHPDTGRTFYYPKELKSLSFKTHLQQIFRDKLYLFFISILTLSLVVFLFNDKIKAR